jgi:hypothetical protein
VGEERHAQFLSALEGSQQAVAAVARWLRGWDRDVYVPPLRKAPRAKDAPEYSDAGDLFVDGRRVEVRQSMVRGWTCASDWPFKDYLVEHEQRVKEFGHEIIAYMEVNTQLTHVGIVLPHTQHRWHLKQTRNPITKELRMSYACPLDCVHFRRIAP